jgi:hypothetical protein
VLSCSVHGVHCSIVILTAFLQSVQVLIVCMFLCLCCVLCILCMVCCGCLCALCALCCGVLCLCAVPCLCILGCGVVVCSVGSVVLHNRYGLACLMRYMYHTVFVNSTVCIISNTM